MKCSICSGKIDKQKHPITGKVYWTKGHNAQPINDGRCCSKCNYRDVLKQRFKDAGLEWSDNIGVK
tara:strand:+ start:1243 stop:1440 length:198 start_codon:yes stop_codon:yes gene_type:complete